MKWNLPLSIAVWLTTVATCGYGADWPQWRGLNRDGKSPETGLKQEWPAEGLTPLWVVTGLGKGYTTAAVTGECLYTTGMLGPENSGVLFAFDLSGHQRWRTPYGEEWNKTYDGARSTPTVDGDRIYLLSGLGRIVCFDAEGGAILWTLDMVGKFGGEAPRCGFAESLLVDEDRLICTPGGKDASLVALNKTTGETIWTSEGFSDQSAYCSPILVERGGTRLIVTLTARHVVGLEAETGKVVWRQPFDPVAEDPNHSVTPVYENGCVYATSGHGDGGQMFELSPDGRQATRKWADTTLNCLHGGVVLVAGYIYGTNVKGNWVCLELATGNVMYQVEGVGMGSVAYADGMLYCYGEKGRLGLAKAAPTGYDLSSSFKIEEGEGPHWAHPVITGGRLYIRHGSILIAYDVKMP